MHLLIANRGEIALRIVRAAHDLGHTVVAVHSVADAGQPHVRLADESVLLGPAPASQSYLNVEAVIAAARGSGATAVHPGYGFLAERHDFAAACEEAGLAFVGPASDVIALMGDKARAREYARAAGVPTIPGSEGSVESADACAILADDIGWPLALKAAAGGGGRGIRVVPSNGELHDFFGVASREAQAAFGDGRLYAERFIADARHVEVQVLGDGENTIHLYERDCSLQRRRQKLIEEGPGPQVSSLLRERLCTAAVALANAIGYRSAGTVEFLVDRRTEEFFFIEMNTRIQVEHPVTEVLCGIDLVAEQLRIAGGEPLKMQQSDIVRNGAVIELRINAEDPANDWMPSPGVVSDLGVPAGPWVRFDTWLETGSEIVPFYDALLGKLIVWGDDRDRTIARAQRALRELSIGGIKSTAPIFSRVLSEPWFADADYHTTSLESWLAAGVRRE